jgi:DNA-binding GntR family transcriptional regulator
MTMELLQAIAQRFAGRRRTATEHVVELLREAIATGDLPEGAQLPQIELADALGVSRTPVREALRLLEAEGWVTFSPHRGAVVATLSGDDVRQIFEIRFALEALALRKSIPSVSTDVFDQADEILVAMDGERDIGQWVTLNRRFHMVLYTGAGDRLIDLIGSQYDAVDRYLRLELIEMDNAAISQEEHRDILAACRARDVSRAIALCEPHIVGAGVDLADTIERRRRRSA